MTDLLQIVIAGATVGSIYALIALGLVIIFNASEVVNFAQGEFVMLGGMSTVFFADWGLPLPAAAIAAVLVTALVGLGLQKLAIERARGATTVTLIIITIGASIFIRGLAQIVSTSSRTGCPASLAKRRCVSAG
jgi:amino acid/amide ABC transporter membrane protein 1, HAAT family (TC 3.A.1.4.-)